MSTVMERLDKTTVKFTITEAAESFAKAIEDAYKKNAKKFNIPGFRKGRVPRQVIEQTYGKGVFYEDAFNSLLSESFVAALKEYDLEPVARPDVDIQQMEKGKELVYSVTVKVDVEAEVGEYKGVAVEKEKAVVTDEMVQEELNKLLDRNSRMVTVEDRACEMGDTVNINFEGFVDGVAFEGGKGENYDLVLGSKTFIPGFEDQLVGKKAGEEVDVVVTFPAEYQAEELAGKEATFKCTVNEVKVKELPELDDEFAKDVSEFDNLTQLKADLQLKLEKQEEERINGEFEDKVLREVVLNSTVEAPEVLVDNQVDQMLRDYDFRLRYSGLDLNRYLEMTGMKIEDFRAQFKEEAEFSVKAKKVLKAIAKAESIQVTEEDTEKEIEKMATMYQMDMAELKKAIREQEMENIHETVLLGKALDFIVSQAVAK